VHPVLSGKAGEKLKASRLQRLLVTNTLPIPASVMSSKIEVLSLAPQLATAMLHIHDGSSVSALFT
jgi:ribose-phosphate pyrophosphokinase